MKCAICGKEITAGASPRARKYCSPACKQKAYELRKKIGAKPAVKHAKTTVTVPVNKHVQAELTRSEFDAMNDGSKLDKLRFLRDVLEKALVDDDTKGSALPAISKQLIDLYERIDQTKADEHVGVGDEVIDVEVVDDDEEFDGVI